MCGFLGGGTSVAMVVMIMMVIVAVMIIMVVALPASRDPATIRTAPCACATNRLHAPLAYWLALRMERLGVLPTE